MAIQMFLTPDKGWWTGLRWSSVLRTFLPCDVQQGEPQFMLHSPTREQVHERYGDLCGLPRNGSMDLSGTHSLIWGDGRELGLVRQTKNVPKEFSPHPTLTLALARIIREEIGMEGKRMEESPTESIPAGIAAEGNSDSPSGSGSASTAETAGSAGTATAAQP